MLPATKLLYVQYQGIQLALPCHQLSGNCPRALQELMLGERGCGCGFGVLLCSWTPDSQIVMCICCLVGELGVLGLAAQRLEENMVADCRQVVRAK